MPCYDDVSVGMEIGPLVKQPTTQQLARFAGAVDDYNQIHYDKDFALSTKLPGVIVHGALKNAFLAQLITDWTGTEGTLKKLSCSYRSMDFPGDTLTCRGKVSNKYVKDGQNIVEYDIWLENGKGERTTIGSATVELPARGG
ncbi:MAG: dehydratase [Chloroflexi bacterium]|nr:dehydratase [Chloroflexota bacterium]